MLIDIIAGARPNFMKIAPIIQALKLRHEAGSILRYRLVHTGQHYDISMSDAFFKQLNIPKPDVNLNIGGGSQAEQTAHIMMSYENLLMKSPSSLCLVVGDVTSSMACAITAKKLQIPVAHIEAGIRSYDWSMPEEINRVVTDSITNWFFTTSKWASTNLQQSGVDESRIFFVGNTMIDTLLAHMSRFSQPDVWNSHNLISGNYFVLTMHRPGNVDTTGFFAEILQAIGEHSRGFPVVFPVHPRTAKTLKDLVGLPLNFILTGPQPYLQFNYLVKHAKAVITDSGGISEEATVMGVPCLTLRNNTERPETIEQGTNELIGTNPTALKLALDRVFDGAWKKGTIPCLWDGKASERIVAQLEKLLVH